MKLIVPTWDPFRELDTFQNRLQSILPANWNRDIENGEGAWRPAVDIAEDDKEYTITADLPDVKKDEVDVTLEDNVLTITGERKKEAEESGKTFHRIERSYGKYVRSFTLPDDVADDKLDATFKDGVLSVHIPKSPAKKKPEQRKVAIH